MGKYCDLCVRESDKLSVRKVNLGGLGLEARLCEKCKKEVEDSRENGGKPLNKIVPRSPQELCVKCGLCCVALVAKLQKGEAETLGNHFGVPIDRFTMPYPKQLKEDGDSDDALLFKFPCEFLMGKPLDYIGCRAYGKGIRPSVCKNYLCKVALAFTLRSKSLGESLFILRSVYIKGDIATLNWGFDKRMERKLLLDYNVNQSIDKLRKSGMDDTLAGFIAAKTLTKRWNFTCAEDQSLFSMMMCHSERGTNSLKFYIPQEELDQYTEEQREFALKVVDHVLSVIRDTVEEDRPEDELNVAWLETSMDGTCENNEVQVDHKDRR